MTNCSYLQQPLGQIDCGCRGKPKVYGCSHPDNTSGMCLQHAPGNAYTKIVFNDKTTKRVTMEERKDIRVCALCKDFVAAVEEPNMQAELTPVEPGNKVKVELTKKAEPARKASKPVKLSDLRRPNIVPPTVNVAFNRSFASVKPHTDFNKPFVEPVYAANTLPIRQLTTDIARGIVTGARSIHWPCLGALAIAAYEQNIGLAVADHGLADWQHAELERIGVYFIQHDKPALELVRDKTPIIAEVKAWWKPQICLASPFETSIWIDSDAVVLSDLSSLFASATSLDFQVATELLWNYDSIRLYSRLATAIFGAAFTQKALASVCNLNTGILVWKNDCLFLQTWSDWCSRLINNDDWLARCSARNQSGFLVAMLDNNLLTRELPTFLPNRFNVPADYLDCKQAKKRKAVSFQPAVLLEQARKRHPDATIVHWCDLPKPWHIPSES